MLQHINTKQNDVAVPEEAQTQNYVKSRGARAVKTEAVNIKDNRDKLEPASQLSVFPQSP